MAYVPKAQIKGKKAKIKVREIEADIVDTDDLQIAGLEFTDGTTKTNIAASTDIYFILPGHATTDIFTVQDDASHDRFKVDGAGTVTIAGGLVIPYGHHTGILIADLQATFGDPAGLATGFTAVYKDDTTAKIYTVHVVGGAFYLHEAAAAAAA